MMAKTQIAVYDRALNLRLIENKLGWELLVANIVL